MFATWIANKCFPISRAKDSIAWEVESASLARHPINRLRVLAAVKNYGLDADIAVESVVITTAKGDDRVVPASCRRRVRNGSGQRVQFDINALIPEALAQELRGESPGPRCCKLAIEGTITTSAGQLFVRWYNETQLLIS